MEKSSVKKWGRPVIRDPLYRAILDGLDQGVDPDDFELFAVEVVRQEYPSAVAVVGRSDGGVDGWTVSSNQQKIPIIVTTAKDALGNLRRNLTRCKKEWSFEGGLALFVTDRLLTPKRQQNLTNAAKAIGFSLHIYERESVARRIYHLPRWRKDLLGLGGDLPALSQIPVRVGIWADLELVGRDEELQWLLRQDSDCLIHGQPASGKTFLLE